MDIFQIPSRDHIEQAASRFEERFDETPVLSSERINRDLGAEVFFKMESLMPQVGVFKIRGALQAVLSLSEEERRHGVLAQSSGNHGQSVAYVARELGIPSYVVVPENAPEVKKEAMRYFGAELILSKPDPVDREAVTKEVSERLDVPLIHPFRNAGVIAGQATATRAMISQVPGLEDLIIQIGGGGLISGSVLAKEYYASQLRVHGAEAELADDYFRKSQRLPERDLSGPESVADGMRVPIGDINAEIIDGRIESVMVAKEAEIVSAMFYLWQHLRVIVEPSAVVGFAAFRQNIADFVGRRVGVILTGGNVDLTRAFELFQRYDLI